MKAPTRFLIGIVVGSFIAPCHVKPAAAGGEKFWVRIGACATSKDIELVQDPGVDPSLAGYGVELNTGAEFVNNIRVGAGVLGRAPRSFENPESGSVSAFGLAEYSWDLSANSGIGFDGGIGRTWFYGSPEMRGELVPSTAGLFFPSTIGIRGNSPMFRGEIFLIHKLAHWCGIRVSAGYFYSKVSELKDTDGNPIISPSGERYSVRV